VLLRTGLAARIALDAPNHRSLHVNPIPRAGGLVVLGVALGLVAWRVPQLRAFLALAAGLVVVCAWDDRLGLPVL
jgi:UDP-N-acetylmuramyl pentapeptide phosphotransferase/UDP-N-acetylglucosamine-1-phosphate transferase